jgi:hypothetical protein
MWTSGGKDCKSLIHLTIASADVANNHFQRSIFRLSRIPPTRSPKLDAKPFNVKDLIRIRQWMSSDWAEIREVDRRGLGSGVKKMGRYAGQVLADCG